MLELLFVPVAVLYLAVISALFVYGLNFFYLVFRTLRPTKLVTLPDPPADWPSVTVQLPIYNERYVVDRLIDAAAALDYPRLTIQVLDDSTDDTVDLVDAAVLRARRQGVAIEVIRRDDRRGFKAGALAVGLATTDADLIAIFDADFVPRPDFLRRTIGAFADPTIAFVQGRWGHTNRTYSFLTFIQSLSIDAHFMVEQCSRSRTTGWFNFNGTAGIWRRSALIDAGGWSAETLTEDLDLSYRAFLRGWRAAYLRDVEVPAELPVAFSAYRRQQSRWARGSLECAAKLLPRIWQSEAAVGRKIQASLHLTGYAVHLLMFALVLLYPVLLVLSQQYAGLLSLFGIAPVFNITALAPLALFVAAQQQSRRRWLLLAPVILVTTALGSGMMVNTLRAALLALRKGGNVFERTPKFGIVARGQRWTRRSYQLGLDGIVLAELFFAAFTAATAVYALAIGNWVIAFYSVVFSAGLLVTSQISIWQALQVARQRIPAEPLPETVTA